MFNAVFSSHDFYHYNIFILCSSFYQHYIPNGSFIPRIALWLLVFLIISAIHLFISICLFKIWLLFYSFSYLELILTLTDVFPNFQVNSCSLQKCWQLQKNTDTQNHSLPRVFSFSSPSLKIFFAMFKESQKSLRQGLQVTGQLYRKPDPSTVQSVERQNYQETRSRFCFIF